MPPPCPQLLSGSIHVGIHVFSPFLVISSKHPSTLALLGPYGDDRRWPDRYLWVLWASNAWHRTRHCMAWPASSGIPCWLGLLSTLPRSKPNQGLTAARVCTTEPDTVVKLEQAETPENTNNTKCQKGNRMGIVSTTIYGGPIQVDQITPAYD
ncbi:hypothetical protein VTL71DRAFT_2318 [Oculimacula yallundae]|uniref:Uncharacterized protein n=1 Tax=Oculimacula yallundae TaxID=86028 RepID=A0ABR4C8J5_9HELO